MSNLRDMQLNAMREDILEERRRRPPPARPSRGTGYAPREVGYAPREVDVHELLKATDDMPKTEDYRGISDQYIVLDSFSKLQESQVERGELRWNLMVQGVTGDEVIGVKDTIDSVIAIQVGAFTLPQLPEVAYNPAGQQPPITGGGQLVLAKNNDNPTANGAPTLVRNATAAAPAPPVGQYPAAALLPGATSAGPWVNNPYSQLPYGNLLTVQIREAGLQSYSDRGGARHHFEFTAAYLQHSAGLNPNQLHAMPKNGTLWDTYVFTEPLKDIHGLSLVFRNPDAPVVFEPDVYPTVAVDAVLLAAPPVYGAINIPYLRFAVTGHNLNMGDRVYVSGFASASGMLNSYINRAEGHVVSGEPNAAVAPGSPIAASAAGPDHFYLDPAVSIADMPNVIAQLAAAPLTAKVFVAKRRIRIPMRLRRVVTRHTNYIAPSL